MKPFNLDEQLNLWNKSIYDAIKYINGRSEQANQKYDALLDKFNRTLLRKYKIIICIWY